MAEVTIFVVGRNEIARLPIFLQHYRMLGIARFHYIDNGSTDGTAEYLKGQPDVDRVYVSETYGPGNAFGSRWQMERIRAYCPKEWVVALDMDELLYLPLDVNIDEMTDHLDEEGANMMKFNLVDCYPRGLLQDADMSDCVWLDRPYSDAQLKERRLSNCQRLGRLRHRVFGMINAYFMKSVLFRANESVDTNGGFHQLLGDLRRSRQVGMIAHCKYVSTFKAYVDDSVQRGVHWNGSRGYRQYQEGYRDVLWHPKYSIHFPCNLHRLGLLSNEGYVAGEGGHILGDYNHFGYDGFAKDDAAAFELWRADAEKGVPDAMGRLAYAYSEGVGCKPDLETATEWQRKHDECL